MTQPLTSNVPSLTDWLKVAPLRDRAVVLIYVHPARPTTQAHTLGEKRDLLAAFEEGGLLLVGWTGRWKTDVRYADATDRAALADSLA